MSLIRVGIWSPNYSGRGGATVRLIVLHTSEGAQDFYSLGNFFKGDVGASSHVGIDNKIAGTIGEYVSRGSKAWTACNANPYAVQAELCTPSGAAAGWSRDYWLNQQRVMLDNAAAWVAEEAAAFGLPIVGLTPSQAQGSGRGVCQHNDLGSWGCGHYDCGDGFPIDYVLEKAGGQAPDVPPPSAAGGKAPPFPYPSGHYLGQPDPAPECHSGYYGGVDTTNVRTWQTQMLARGWAGLGAADGMYGPASDETCRQFQAEKGLSAVDGLVGPETWGATWTAPIT